MTTWWLHDRTGKTLCNDGNGCAEPDGHSDGMHKCANCGMRLGVGYDHFAEAIDAALRSTRS